MLHKIWYCNNDCLMQSKVLFVHPAYYYMCNTPVLQFITLNNSFKRTNVRKRIRKLNVSYCILNIDMVLIFYNKKSNYLNNF